MAAKAGSKERQVQVAGVGSASFLPSPNPHPLNQGHLHEHQRPWPGFIFSNVVARGGGHWLQQLKPPRGIPTTPYTRVSISHPRSFTLTQLPAEVHAGRQKMTVQVFGSLATHVGDQMKF